MTVGANSDAGQGEAQRPACVAAPVDSLVDPNAVGATGRWWSREQLWVAACAEILRSAGEETTPCRPDGFCPVIRSAWELSLIDRGRRPMRVLQVGADPLITGALCHVLGDRHVVVSTDAHPETTVDFAVARGWFPEVITGPPGAETGRHGPYDAIHIRAGHSHIPPACLQQLTDGGRLVFASAATPDEAAVLERRLDGRLTARRGQATTTGPASCAGG